MRTIKKIPEIAIKHILICLPLLKKVWSYANWVECLQQVHKMQYNIYICDLCKLGKLLNWVKCLKKFLNANK